MAEKEIKITFPEEKMEALVFFLGEQNEQVENVLKTHLDKTYEKIVPAQVRKFVESRISGQEEEDQQQGSGHRQTRGQGRRSGRQREQDTGQNNSTRIPAEEEEQAEDSGLEQEETSGMNMNM